MPTPRVPERRLPMRATTSAHPRRSAPHFRPPTALTPLVMKQLFFLLSLPVLVLFASCASLRGGDAYRPDEPLSVVAKVSAEADLSDATKGVGGTLRMKRDAVIQLSLTKFGIEGARLVFTPDSITVLDRLNKRYLRTSYAELQQALQFDRPLTFATVQSFFWNDRHLSKEESELVVNDLVHINLHVRRSNTVNIHGFPVARLTQLLVQVLDRDLRFNLALSNVKLRYDWSANTRIPDSYKPMDGAVLRRLIQLAQ